MGRKNGFQTIDRQTSPKKPPAVRIKDYKEFVVPLPEETMEQQASRCMDCGVPFCHSACPLSNALPDVHELVSSGHWRRALDYLHASNNFPEFTGRLCPAFCEAACALGIIKAPMNNREIELAVIERGFREGWVEARLPKNDSGKKVAVIGSGPAGMACAQQLVRAGHQVTLFERSERLGGILSLGIPDYKLEKWVVDRRLHQLEEEGVVFRAGVQVGLDIPGDELLRDFDAVCLAIGATVPRDIDVKGRKLDNIHYAMDYLMQQNRQLQGSEVPEAERISATGKHVVIIGGGDTGADCLGIALRQGAESVIQLEMLPEPPKERSADSPWLEWPRIQRSSTAHEEGGERRYSVGTRYFKGADGAVASVGCVELQWHPGGTWTEIPGTRHELKADLVILAMGFLHGEQENLIKQLGITVDERGNIAADANGQTTKPGIFTAGDGHLGPSLVCKAIADGRRAAAAIESWFASELKTASNG